MLLYFGQVYCFFFFGSVRVKSRGTGNQNKICCNVLCQEMVSLHFGQVSCSFSKTNVKWRIIEEQDNIFCKVCAGNWYDYMLSRCPVLL